MSLIKYIALREIPKTGVAASGTDISASTTDDSFNSTSTDLSGFSAGDWIEVSGGTNAAWYQLAVDSTANKIVVPENINTEAAGALITITGYVRGKYVEYSLEWGAPKLDQKEEEKVHDSVAEDGSYERSFIRMDSGWMVDSAFIKPDAQAQYNEFRHSVNRGETFTFDAYGTVATPDNPQTVKLKKITGPRRVGSSRMVQYSLELKNT